MKTRIFLLIMAIFCISINVYAQQLHMVEIHPLADVWDNAESEKFFKIPELSSDNGKLEVHLFINEDTYTLGGDQVKLRSYSYESNGIQSNNYGPFGPTLRVKPSDRLTMIVHNKLPEGPDHNYLGSVAFDDKNVSLLKEGDVSNDLTTVLILGTGGRITCGNLKGATTKVVEKDSKWIIFAREPCACPPGLEGTCTLVPVQYHINKMFNLGSDKYALRIYEEKDHSSHNHNIPHGFNTTNMHAHGFHVSPFQDDIFRTVEPSFSSYYTYDLEEHTPGTMWYHPHVHGSTALQVASGMSGVIIIEDNDLEKYPDLAAATLPEHERILMFNQIRYDPEIRELPDFNTMLRVGNPMGTTVNGQVVPFMPIAPGEVQRWRMVHSGYSSLLGLYFPPEIEVYQIAVDGIMFDKPKRMYSIHMAPGNRSDILIRVPEGTNQQTINIYSMGYKVACEYFPEDPDCVKIDTSKSEAVMKLVVEGLNQSMKIPTVLPGPGPHHSTIKDSEIVNLRNPRKTKFQIDAVGPNEYAYLVNGKPFEAGVVHETLTLGQAEVWSLTAKGNHPYHIHINPFQVTEIFNPTTNALRTVDPPIWKDVALVNDEYGAKIRARYQKYWGDFVLHCHILHHEDQGMMQRISIQKEKRPLMQMIRKR